MKIEWDPNKARSNLRKHKVSFEEASTALFDTMSVTGADPDHSVGDFDMLLLPFPHGEDFSLFLMPTLLKQSESLALV